MSIFITGMIVGTFLYILGKVMEHDERKRREREERERSRWRD